MPVLVALDGRGEDAGDIQRLEVGVGGLLFRLYGGEEGVVFDGGVDRGSGEQGIEAAATLGFVVFLQEGLADGAFSGRGFQLPCFSEIGAGSGDGTLGVGSSGYWGILPNGAAPDPPPRRRTSAVRPAPLRFN